jgi:hypothetical protein
MQRLLGISQSLKQERRWHDLTSQYNLDEALAMAANKSLPILVSENIYLIEKQDLASYVGQDRSHPHSVTGITIRLPGEGQSNATLLFEIQNQPSLFVNDEQSDSSKVHSFQPETLNLIDWLYQGSPIFLDRDQKATTHYRLIDNCPISIQKSDGRHLQMSTDRLETMRAIQRETTERYQKANSVEMRDWGNRVELKIDDEVTSLERFMKIQFSNAIKDEIPYTVKTPSNRLITIEHTALCPWKYPEVSKAPPKQVPPVEQPALQPFQVNLQPEPQPQPQPQPAPIQPMSPPSNELSSLQSQPVRKEESEMEAPAKSKRSIALWSGSALVGLLAGVGLYQWARNRAAFGNWVKSYTPNWISNRLVG